VAPFLFGVVIGSLNIVVQRGYQCGLIVIRRRE